ncbi:MAG: hemolysin III family protein [Pseudomonadota bacterium]|nr:hemolysin III family protein [Pseudomonadota bacterium]
MTRADSVWDPLPSQHYPNDAERVADFWVHAIGLAAALIGGGVLFTASLQAGGMRQATAIALYALCLVAMLVCSWAYNLTRPSRLRPLLLRLDQSAIFLLIAGSYTPFTSQRLEGAWAVGMTTLVWAMALAGVAGKLLLPRLPEKFWVGAYIAFSWVAVIALKPLLDNVSLSAMLLLLIGGLVYMSGVPLFLHNRLPFRRAIWHGFVVAAAAIQQAAIWTGVVLAPAA